MFLQWDEKFPNLQIEYEHDVPQNAEYWSTIPRDSLGNSELVIFLTSKSYPRRCLD